jgi:hypothetical protein
LTETQLRLCGRWGEKGLAILHDGKQHTQVEIPPALFDLLAILILVEKKPIPPDASWAPTGFITAEELCRELTRRGGSDPRQPWYDKKYVNRLVYRLRMLLATALFPQGKHGREWRNQFLETGPLGYRLSTDPVNLQLAIGLDGDQGPAWDLAGIDRRSASGDTSGSAAGCGPWNGRRGLLEGSHSEIV